MKSALTLITFLIVATSFAKPQIYFNYKIFHTPDQRSFVSTSLQFIGGSFKFRGNETGDLTAQVEITQIFTRNDSIIIADKYLLDSPIMKDSIVDDFYDVRRYALDPGMYEYEISIKDVISGLEVTGKQPLEVTSIDPNKISISDIELIEDAYATTEQNNFTKNGFFILPYLTNYFPPEVNKLAFYSEIYNSEKQLGKNEPFLMTCSVEDYDTGKSIENIFKFKRMTAAPVNPAITVLSIAQLPSGNYNLVIHLISKTNDTLTSKRVFFQRRNEAYDNQITTIENLEIDPSFRESVEWDSVPYFLGSLIPISQRFEYDNIRKLLKSEDTTYMEKYLFAYWRETAPEDPARAWRNYRAQVYYTERLFGTQIKYGWETDRGRVHLKYGSPNAVVDRQREAETPPYQIWHYYRIGQRSNVRFVFYNPSRATNDYPLLHSDMQGELQNLKWQEVLNGTTVNNAGDVSNPNGVEDPNSWSGTLFNGGF